jgi:hypothetical protein
MKNDYRVYLLARVRDDQILGFGTFSEDSPTVMERGHWLTIATAEAETYEKARVIVLREGVSIGPRLGPRCAAALKQLSEQPNSRGVLLS